jgi:hypothetical protein
MRFRTKSRSAAGRKARISERLSVSVALIALGLVSQPVSPSTHVLERADPTAADLNQSSERATSAGNGIIAGVVVNERQEPVVRAQVQAFSVRKIAPQVQQPQSSPFSMRAQFKSEKIGDKRAVGPLLDALDDDSPSMRVLSIYALETLNATEAIPRLISLQDDLRKSNFGAQVSVAEAAKAALAKLQ